MELEITVTVAFILWFSVDFQPLQRPIFQLDIWPHNSPNCGSFGHSLPLRIHPPFWTCLVWSGLKLLREGVNHAQNNHASTMIRCVHAQPLQRLIFLPDIWPHNSSNFASFVNSAPLRIYASAILNVFGLCRIETTSRGCVSHAQNNYVSTMIRAMYCLMWTFIW